MSFHVSFVARSVPAARLKLAQAPARAVVKLLIERALAAIALPSKQNPAEVHEEAYAEQAVSGRVRGVNMAAEAPRKPQLLGVMVEAWGHLSEPGDDEPNSWLEKLSVRPLVD
jgi:hypothetical protein